MKQIKRNFFVFLLVLFLAVFTDGDFMSVSAAEKPEIPSITVTKGSDNESITVYIGKTSYADGYGIYYKEDNQEKLTKLTVLKEDGSKVRFYTVNNLDEGKYLIAVRAYCTVKGKKIWGDYAYSVGIEIPKKYSKRDTVKFGTYEQDLSSKGKEPIEWIVLNVDEKNNRVLLLSKYVLDWKYYLDKTTFASITWEKSFLRKWLNNDFYKSAFSKNERKQIKKTKILNPDNQELDSKGGNDTKDRVFILSVDEVMNEKYGFSSSYGYYDINRRCSATEYCIEFEGFQEYRSKFFNSKGITDEGKVSVYWWIRTPGFGPQQLFIDELGAIDDLGAPYKKSFIGVRPAIYIKLDYYKSLCE